MQGESWGELFVAFRDIGKVCDEVSCVLSNYEGACCTKYRKVGFRNSDEPEALDRKIIADGLAPVKGAVIDCGQKLQAVGIVKVGVKVNPDGKVASITINKLRTQSSASRRQGDREGAVRQDPDRRKLQLSVRLLTGRSPSRGRDW